MYITFNMNYKYLYASLFFFLCPCISNSKNISDKIVDNYVYYADPTMIMVDNKFYITGTKSINPQGFTILESSNLKKWSKERYIITCGNRVFGDKDFWAPQIFHTDNKWYLAYTANEQIAVAEADNLDGPYYQTLVQPIDSDEKKIDPFIFQDDDGKFYIYHVRFNNGNFIWVAKYDIKSEKMDKSTLTKCLDNTEPWERTSLYTSDPIMEGPTVIKNQGVYYLFYSANHFKSIDYAVGYATSKSPYGPWIKHKGPIISRKNIGHNGTGHGDMLKYGNNKWLYVFHTHNNDSTVAPRKTAIVELKFKDGEYSIKKRTFRFLNR